MTEKIQIAIPCGYNSEHYINFLLDTIVKTVSDPERIEVLLGINKPNLDKDILLKNKDVFNIKSIDAISPHNNSRGHGFCLDEMLKHMDSKYGMFVDCDVAFLEKNWDTKLIDLLVGDKVVIGAGTAKNHHHYYNFPFTIMSLFKVSPLKEVGISFMPKLVDLVLTEENADIFGRNVGEKIHLDTAWEMPLKLKTNGYDGVALKLVTPRDHSRDNIKFMTSDMRGEEQQLDGVPYFTHVGRSQSRPFNSPIVVKWRHRVDDWIRHKNEQS